MTDDNVQGLENLEIWKKAIALALAVCQQVIPVLPADEKWVLNQEIRRSAQSIPANIAEGHGRFYYQENIRFCYIARGSLIETYSHLSLAHGLHYISSEMFNHLKNQIEELVRMINGYIAYLKRTKSGQNEPGAQYFVHEESSEYSVENNGNLESA